MSTGIAVDQPVVVIGAGCVTAVGLTAPATAAAVRSGIANLTDHPGKMAADGQPRVVAMVPSVDPEMSAIERFRALTSAAVMEALEPLGASGRPDGEVPVFIGLPEPRPGLPEGLADELTETVHTIADGGYPIGAIRTGMAGHAAGLLALAAGLRAIRSGARDFCLIGGVDSYLTADTLDWVEHGGQLHNSANAWGFVPGEAAGFCLLGSRAAAERHGLPTTTRVLAVSDATEENRIKTETICIGQGLTQAVRTLTDKLPSDWKIDHTICDQNGEAYRADEFGFMLARLSEHFRDPSDFIAPADCWGDVGAASGPLYVMLAAEAARGRSAALRRILVWASSESGRRAAAILASGPKLRD